VEYARGDLAPDHCGKPGDMMRLELLLLVDDLLLEDVLLP
jgi:hypothetical protein